MGSNLCTSRKSNAAPLANHDDTDDDEYTSVLGRNSFLELLKPRCLSIAKRKKEMDPQENIGKEKQPTLGEWFLSPSSFESDDSNASGVQHWRQSPLANLCNYRKSNAAPLANHDDTDDEDTSVHGRNSFLELLKPRCFSIAKQEKEMDHRENIGKETKPTLEEWFLSSPSFESNYSNASGVQHRRQSPKVCPLTSKMGNYGRLSPTPRESFSIDGVMHGEVAQGERLVPLSRSQSRQGKRVSFRLPEEADIHIIYCQDDSVESAVVGKE